MHPGRPEGCGDDDVARLEGRGSVARAAIHAIEDVARELLVVGFLLRGVDAGMDRLEVSAFLVVLGKTCKRSADLHGLLEVHDRVQRLVLDEDELRAVLGCRLALGDDDRDGLAREHDLVARQGLRRAVASADRRDVPCREHRDHARHLEGGFAVHGTNARVRFRREHGPRVQQPVDVAVRRVPRHARHLLGRVDPRARDADQCLAHASSSARARALASARSTSVRASWRR